MFGVQCIECGDAELVRAAKQNAERIGDFVRAEVASTIKRLEKPLLPAASGGLY